MRVRSEGVFVMNKCECYEVVGTAPMRVWAPVVCVCFIEMLVSIIWECV